MNDAQKEQIKLRAAALDRVSTACATVGVLGPLAGALYQETVLKVADWKLFVATLVYLGGAIALHNAALYTLESLDE